MEITQTTLCALASLAGVANINQRRFSKMAIQTFKLWAHRSIEPGERHGRITIYPFAPDATSQYSPAVSAGEFEVELDILEDENNAAEIEALESRLQVERADSMQRQNILLDRISKLKAIGHDAPADDAINEDYIPY